MTASTLDMLVNNAGIMDRFLPAADTPKGLWERVLRVNLTGPFHATKQAIPPMLEGRGGVIINIASVGGLRGGAAGAAYTSSKHGLIGLTKSTAANYAADGIRCIAICPGGVDTGISPGRAQRGYATLNRILPAMARLASPAEIDVVALICASDEASFLERSGDRSERRLECTLSEGANRLSGNNRRCSASHSPRVGRSPPRSIKEKYRSGYLEGDNIAEGPVPMWICDWTLDSLHLEGDSVPSLLLYSTQKGQRIELEVDSWSLIGVANFRLV